MPGGSYLLGTNVVVAVLRGRPPLVRERMRGARAAGASLALPAVALFELEYGVALSGRPVENARRLRAFLSGDVAVLPFAEEDAAVAGRLRASLGATGKPSGLRPAGRGRRAPDEGDARHGQRLGVRAGARPGLGGLDRPGRLTRRRARR